jgi:hypothetical protein
MIMLSPTPASQTYSMGIVKADQPCSGFVMQGQAVAKPVRTFRRGGDTFGYEFDVTLTYEERHAIKKQQSIEAGITAFRHCPLDIIY